MYGRPYGRPSHEVLTRERTHTKTAVGFSINYNQTKSADTCQELTRLIVADGDRRGALTPVVNKYTMQLINRANKAAPSPDLALALDMLKHTTE